MARQEFLSNHALGSCLFLPLSPCRADPASLYQKSKFPLWFELTVRFPTAHPSVTSSQQSPCRWARMVGSHRINGGICHPASSAVPPATPTGPGGSPKVKSFAPLPQPDCARGDGEEKLFAFRLHLLIELPNPEPNSPPPRAEKRQSSSHRSHQTARLLPHRASQPPEHAASFTYTHTRQGESSYNLHFNQPNIHVLSFLFPFSPLSSFFFFPHLGLIQLMMFFIFPLNKG